MHAPTLIAIAAHQPAFAATHQSEAPLYGHEGHGTAASPMIAARCVEIIVAKEIVGDFVRHDTRGIERKILPPFILYGSKR